MRLRDLPRLRDPRQLLSRHRLHKFADTPEPLLHLFTGQAIVIEQ